MRTLRHIRQEVYVRLGFVNQASAAANLQSIINSFISEAQSDIYWLHGFENTRAESTINTVIGQTLYDWPTKVDSKRRINVNVKIDNNVWLPLKHQRINWEHDTYVDSANSYPIIYDANAKLEVWPKPDAIYPLRIEHFAKLGLFIEPEQYALNRVYKEGDYILSTDLTDWPLPLNDVLDKNHFVYECTTPGTSSATTAPAWPVVDGGTVNDNGVVWTARLNTATVPDELILRLALFKAKLHYRQPDAESAFNAFQALLTQMKAGDIEGMRYIKKKVRQGLYSPQDPPWIPPKRV